MRGDHFNKSNKELEEEEFSMRKCVSRFCTISEWNKNNMKINKSVMIETRKSKLKPSFMNFFERKWLHAS